MWLPTAMVAAAIGAGLMAGVMAYLAVVERENRVWRLWSASFALDTLRSLVLYDGLLHGTPNDLVAEALSIGHVGFLAVGVLWWVDVAWPRRSLAVGGLVSAAVVLSGLVISIPEDVLHVPVVGFSTVALGLSSWGLWTDACPKERALRRVMAVITGAWAVQDAVVTSIGDYERLDGAGFTALHGFGTALALLLIVGALRRRHMQAEAAIEEARQARIEVERANRRLSDFASVSSDWFWEQDANLRFTYLSASVVNHSGAALEDYYGKTRRETQPIGISEADWETHEEVLRRREPFKDFRLYRKGPDGKERYLSISGSPVFDEAGAFLGYRGIGRDLTELAKAEQRVNAVNTRLIQALDARSEGLAFWDVDDRLVICNKAYRDQSGATGARLAPGVRYADFMRASVEAGEIPAAVGREQQWLQERFDLRANLPYTVEIFRGGRWLLVHEQRTPDGGVLLTSTDISELKNREDALIEAVAEAQLANRAKMSFLATMSHELRTPLNAIIGFAEIIQSGQLAAKSAVQTEYAGYIHESGAHLLSVINDLLDVSRIEAGKLSLDEKPFALSSLLEECDRTVRQKAQAGGLRLAIATVEPGLGIRGDRRAMKQVLINLLSNAVKFTESGGAVTLTAERDPDGDFKIVVSDTGIGVPEENLQDLFEPFRQLDNVHARRHHGTGLGLYISKSLVEAHGGTIRFESVVGQGSTVTVTLGGDRIMESGSQLRQRAVG